MDNNRVILVGPLDDIRHVRRRRRRTAIVIAVLLAIFVGCFGCPYLRITYSYKPLPGGRKYVTDGCYWSLTGSKNVVAGDYGTGPGGCPLIIFVPVSEVAADVWWQLTASSSGA